MHRRRWWSAVGAVMAVGAIAALTAVAPPAAEAATQPRTIVSLTFDDGDSNQRAALPALRANGVPATFFVSSGLIGAGGYFTVDDLREMQAAGHEIGGHTVNHPDLATLDLAEASRQICNDRRTLTTWGLNVRSFAYPFASATPEVQAIARDCGFRSARLLGDLATRDVCAECEFTEDFSPANPYGTRALAQFEADWTLEDLQQGVLNAERVGGWVQFTFHDVCFTGCGDLAVSPKMFGQFVSWLKAREATNGTVVRTVGDVIGGDALPVVAGPAVAAPGPGENGIVNAGFEKRTAEGLPACWSQGYWGDNRTDFSVSALTRRGAHASAISMREHSTGDAKVLPKLDLGECSPTVKPRRTYSLRTWYTSSTVTQYAVYLRDRTGAWSYWTSSPWFPPATKYTQAEWTTPPIPTGYTGLSFALNIFGDGRLRTDDVALYDTIGAPPKDANAISAPHIEDVPPPGGAIEVVNESETAEE